MSSNTMPKKHRRDSATSLPSSRLRSTIKRTRAAATNPSPDNTPGGMGTILAIAATLIAGIFAALGVSGSLLARMVRNDAYSARNVLLLAIVGVVTLAVVAAFRAKIWLFILPLLLLGVSLWLAASVAAESQRQRENPSISLTVSHPSSGPMTLTAKATGSSLRSSERMLLRVAYILRSLSITEIQDSSDPGYVTTELRERTNQECKRAALHPFDAKTARLLSWTETGPNASGEATIEQTLPLPPHATYVCAWVSLSERIDRSGPIIADDIAIVDVEAMRDP